MSTPPKMDYPRGIVFELRRNASSWSRAKGDGARLFEKMLTAAADEIERLREALAKHEGSDASEGA